MFFFFCFFWADLCRWESEKKKKKPTHKPKLRFQNMRNVNYNAERKKQRDYNTVVARREKQCKELKLYKDMTQIKFNASSSWKKNEKKTNTTGRHGERKRLFNTSFSTSESHDWRFELNWSELFFPLHPSVCRDHETHTDHNSHALLPLSPSGKL